MRWRTPIVVSLALIVAASCDSTPVDPPADQAAESPLFDAGKSPNKGMELIWEFPYPEEEGYLDHIPCFNGGEGEDVIAFGYIAFWARTVETPSGNYKQHGELRGFENYRGQQTGELWEGTGITVPTIFYNTRHSDGYTTINEPVWNYVENTTTGEVFRLMWRFHQVIDAEGNFVRADVKLTNCRPWKGRIN